ncbi:GNAT family N-acetyltransferase [Microbacterium sp. NPDC056234]|uniref:GNAT family N-acetyltransferase n=1 Tax=Microbacterium sp. NPDC056234 TaxID=3345757 RepID=UPI0035DB0ECC
MADLLAEYDARLRTEAEMHGAVEVRRAGPLWIARFDGDHLFVTYRELDDTSARVGEVSAILAADTTVRTAEWKTRTHDRAPGLESALTAAAFEPDEPESVMLGEATTLVDMDPPAGVTVRRLTTPSEIRAALDMQDAVFGEPFKAESMLAAILRQQTDGESIEVWAAEADGRIVSAGRIDRIPGTAFAGIWGGATLPEYRGRGIYRALTAARARSAVAQGVRWIHSDSTEGSRPILERAGLVKITETVPWVWQRNEI